MNQVIKTIFVVLGLASAYPDVSFRDVHIYRQNNTACVRFEAGDLLNDSIRGILDAGYGTLLRYNIDTYDGSKLVYCVQWMRAVTNSGGTYGVNQISGLDYPALVARMRKHDFVILTNGAAYRGDQMRTVITISITCDATPDIIELWGNKPKLILNYRMED